MQKSQWRIGILAVIFISGCSSSPEGIKDLGQYLIGKQIILEGKRQQREWLREDIKMSLDQYEENTKLLRIKKPKSKLAQFGPISLSSGGKIKYEGDGVPKVIKRTTMVSTYKFFHSLRLSLSTRQIRTSAMLFNNISAKYKREHNGPWEFEIEFKLNF